MPMAPRTPCCHAGCAELVNGRFCERHSRDHQRRQDADRGSSTKRGYGARWQKARRSFLAKHPLCVACDAAGRVEAANVVDHIVPHRGDQALFWQRANWQALCKRCHDRKTATEDGGFGNRRGQP